MQRSYSTLRCLVLGLVLSLVQISLAVAFAHPTGSLADRYLTLVQHDSYWFANIVERGYGSTVPPIDHKAMEISNVAFFPAYPLLAYGVKKLTGMATYPALLLTAQAATWGFWTYFFLFSTRWDLSPALQTFGALGIVAHPAAFYLVAGYSESLFLMALLGFMYWTTATDRGAGWLAAVHGLIMGATRIVGLPCALFPILQSVWQRGFWTRDLSARQWWTRSRRPILLVASGLFGGLSFFAYCQWHWGRWDLYMLTQEAGWAIHADYLAAFKPASFNFALPSIDEPTRASQFASALAGVVFLAIAFLEVVAARGGRSGWRLRLGFYFAAAVIYYISVSGVAAVHLESMLRYDLCVHALVVLGLLHFLREFRIPPVYVRAFAMGLAALACAAGLGLQGFYVWNFTQGNWIA